jgi:hypothetical protein
MKHRSWRKTAFQPTSLIAGALLLLILFVSAAYLFFIAEPAITPERQAMLAELQLRQSEWLEKRPPAFRYEIERECECPLDYIEPFTVVEYLDEPVNHAWIDDYFTSLENALHTGVVVAISYDPRFSYPNDFRIADEQVYVRDFEVLEYD